MCSRAPYLEIIIIIIIIIVIANHYAPADLVLLSQAGDARGVSRQSAPGENHHHYHHQHHHHYRHHYHVNCQDCSPAAPHPCEADIWGTNLATFGTFWVWWQISFSVKDLFAHRFYFNFYRTCSCGRLLLLTELSMDHMLLLLHNLAQQIPEMKRFDWKLVKFQLSLWFQQIFFQQNGDLDLILEYRKSIREDNLLCKEKRHSIFTMRIGGTKPSVRSLTISSDHYWFMFN